LRKVAKAAKREALRSKRVLEVESRKRAKEKVTIWSYFQSSQDTDNIADLNQVHDCSNRPDLERTSRWR
jgi:hypothetical protein